MSIAIMVKSDSMKAPKYWLHPLHSAKSHIQFTWQNTKQASEGGREALLLHTKLSLCQPRFLSIPPLAIPSRFLSYMLWQFYYYYYYHKYIQTYKHQPPPRWSELQSFSLRFNLVSSIQRTYHHPATKSSKSHENWQS